MRNNLYNYSGNFYKSSIFYSFFYLVMVIKVQSNIMPWLYNCKYFLPILCQPSAAKQYYCKPPQKKGTSRRCASLTAYDCVKTLHKTGMCHAAVHGHTDLQSCFCIASNIWSRNSEADVYNSVWGIIYTTIPVIFIKVQYFTVFLPLYGYRITT